MMTDESLKNLVMQHDKSITQMAMSIEHLALSIGTYSTKIDALIDTVGKQNLLTERFSNFEISINKSMDSIFSRLRDLETSHNGNGCSALRLNVQKDDAAYKRLDKLEVLVDKMTETVRVLDTKETVQGLKIGGAERWFWVVITAITGIAVAQYGH